MVHNKTISLIKLIGIISIESEANKRMEHFLCSHVPGQRAPTMKKGKYNIIIFDH